MLLHKVQFNTGFLKVWLLVAAIIFLNFMFLKIANYPLTLAPAAIIVFLVSLYRFRFPKAAVLTWSLLLSLPFLNLGLSPTTDEAVNFFRTYALWGFAVTALLLASSATLRATDSRWVSRAAFISLTTLTVYSVAQVLLFKYFASSILYNPFGSHQYLYQYDVALYADHIRAPGFYLEPSFNAFVITSLLFITLVSDYRPISALALSGVALFAVQSFSGIIIYVFLLIAYLGLRGIKKRIYMGLTVLFALILGISFSGMRTYIEERITSGSVEGSSTYYRLIGPLKILRDVLVNHPTGLPFGTVQDVVHSYGLLNGSTIGSSLDNGVYLLVFYFGWFAIGALLLVAFVSVPYCKRWGTLPVLFLLGYVLLSMNYSGAIMTPEYVLVIVMVVYSWRASRSVARVNAGKLSAATSDLIQRGFGIERVSG